VPAGTSPGRLQLTGWEYIAEDQTHGNAYVAVERLLAIQSYDTQSGGR
jgi:hypothetical protein